MIKDINNVPQYAIEEEEQITAFLKGEIAADKEQAFMLRLESNPELKAKAIAMARLTKGLKEVGAKRDQETKEAFMSSSIEDIRNATQTATSQKQTKTVTLRRTSVWMSAAASVIFIVWLGIGYHDYRYTTGLANEYADAFGVSMIARGGDEASEVEQRLSRLFENVQTKTALKNTLHELSLCWELSTMQTYNDYTEYAVEIGWNLAIGYLKNNDKKNAKIVLEKLIEISEEGSNVQIQAEDILKHIE